jgi:hypothetical protein
MELVLGTGKSADQMMQEIAALAARKQHRLAAYQVTGTHSVNPAQYEGIMRHLRACPDLTAQPSREEEIAQHVPA